MKRLDGGFLTSLALALSVTLMAGLVGTGAYARAAAGEAVGFSALLHVVAANEVQP